VTRHSIKMYHENLNKLFNLVYRTKMSMSTTMQH